MKPEGCASDAGVQFSAVQSLFLLNLNLNRRFGAVPVLMTKLEGGSGLVRCSSGSEPGSLGIKLS
jgi:hypothetical protein